MAVQGIQFTLLFNYCITYCIFMLLFRSIITGLINYFRVEGEWTTRNMQLNYTLVSRVLMDQYSTHWKLY